MTTSDNQISATSDSPTETSPLLHNENHSDSNAISTFKDESSNTHFRSAVAFVMALMCCACANSIGLFSMYAPGFKHDLGLSLIQINNISVSSSLAMYLPVPFLGYFADKKGPGGLALFSILLFTPAYYVASVVSNVESPDQMGDYRLLALAFGLIGTGTSSLYFSGVITCARVYRKSPGLAISVPVACFGLSSLWEAQFIQRYCVHDDGSLNLSTSFKFFSYLFFFAGILCFASTRVGRVIGPAIKEEKSTSLQSSSDEENPLDNTANLARSPEDMVYKEHETIGQFLSDHTAWLLFAAFVLSSGPLEMFLNNMGIIIDTTHSGSPISLHVSLFSAFSTIARLGMGLVSDMIKDQISRPTLLAFVLFGTSLLHFAIASGLFTVFDDGNLFFIASSGNGFSYGSVYTLIPTIIACTWGVEHLGTHWGFFIVGPAIGSSVFGLLFAKVYETATRKATDLISLATDVAVCTGTTCYRTTFLTTGISFFLSSVFVATVWLYAWKHTH